MSNENCKQLLDEREKIDEIIAKRQGLPTKSELETNKIIAVFLVIMMVFTLFIGYVSIDGKSMQPTILDGEFVFTWKIATPTRGSIVIVDNSDKGLSGISSSLIIKRVVAIEGDEVSYDFENGVSGKVVLKVNGEVVKEDYITEYSYVEAMLDKGIFIPHNNPKKVGKDEFYVLGDNRPNSADSRMFGMIDKSRISGVVFLIIGSGGVRFI